MRRIVINMQGYILQHVYDERDHLTLCGKCGSPRSAHFEYYTDETEVTPEL